MAATNSQQDLLRAAIDLFYEKGYSETSVREIAAEAGVSKSLTYVHFENKEDVLFQIMHCLQRDLLEELTEITERVSDPLDCLREMLKHHMVRFTFKRKKEVKIGFEGIDLLRGKREQIIRQQVYATYDLYYAKLQELAATGQMNSIDLTVLGHCFAALIGFFSGRYHRVRLDGEKPVANEVVVESILTLLFQGMVKPEPVPPESDRKPTIPITY